MRDLGAQLGAARLGATVAALLAMLLVAPLAALVGAAGCTSGFSVVDGGSGGDGGPGDDGGGGDGAVASDGSGDGSSGWTLVYSDPNAGATESLNALWVGGASDVVAVGDNRQIVRFDGKTWDGLVKTNGAHLYGVDAAGSSSIVAVGVYAWNGAPAIFGYDGKLWTAEGPLPSAMLPLSGVWVVGTQRYFIAKDATIYQDDPVKRPTQRYHTAAILGSCPNLDDPKPILWGIDGSGLDNILAVGDRGLMGHFNRSDWVRLCNPDTSVGYRAVLSLPGSTDFYVGSNYLGLLRFSGRADALTVIHEDRAVADADKAYIWSIWGTSSATVIAVGDRGTILYFNGSATGARRLPSPTSGALFAVGGVDERTVYIAGQGNRIWVGALPSD